MTKLKRRNYSSSNKNIFLLALFISSFFFSKAQFNNGSQMTFGKNRVQFTQRQWFYFRFTNFDTYFYKGGKELAIYASGYADQQLKLLSAKLDYTLEEKIKFVIFNDLSDLKETNLGLITNEEYNVGGVTHIIDNKIFIYFNGNHKDFELQIKQGLADLILQQMMYGGSASSKVKNSILLSFPTWYTDGLKSYLGENWNTKIDNIVRQGIASGKFNNFYKLSAEEQVYAGHSIWRYIEEKYGEKSISEILYMAKVNRNIESGFLFILGLSYDMMIEEWMDWYIQKYNFDENANYDEEEIPFIAKPKRGVVYSNVKVSQDGKFLAYSTNQIGKVKVYIKNLETGKTKRILKFGHKLNEKVDYSYPVMTWAPQGNYLTIVREKKDINLLLFYNLDEKVWTKRFLMNFDRVMSMSYNNKGNLIVMSAIQNGQSDIYLYNVGSNSYTQITKDIYDDEQPRFVNNSASIIFSSNRVNDTLRFDVETAKNFIRDTIKGQANKDLFLYNFANQSLILQRITETPLADETFPMPLAFNKFIFLSNESGITNRYIGKFDSTIAYIDTSTHYRYYTNYFPISQSNYTFLEQDVNPSVQKITDVKNYNGRYYIHIKDISTLPSNSSFRIQKTTYMQNLIMREEQRKQELRRKLNSDTLQKAPVEESKKKFKVIYVESEDTKKQQVDINNYTFSKSGDTTNTQTSTKTTTPFTLYSQRNYEVQYSISEIVSQVDFNYLNYSYQPFTNSKTPIYLNPGFNVFMKFGVQDLLEDYRIIGGVRLVNVFSDNEYFLSFANLKHRLDREFIFHRKILEDYASDDQIIKHYIHDAVFNLNFPFNNTSGLRSTFIFTNDEAVRLATSRTSLLKKNIISNKIGMRLEYVFDNTRTSSFNIMLGTRYKIFGEYYQPVQDYKKNLIVLGIDYRKYTKIHKNFIWANRFAASTSLGKERLIYYLGGVDNALFQKFNQNIQVSNTENYAYQTIATNMRGFDQNIRNGNNFMVINSELRLPVFQYFSQKPVKNQFLSNFMVVGFFDVGTAWTGPNPFSDSNSLYVQIEYQQPITVTIINQNDPVVYGYGFGFRSKILGYYTRLDYAWGIQNGYLQKKKIHLSLSLDF